MNEQGQYKDVVHTLNSKLKETKGKLEEAGRQKEMLQKELSSLREQVEKAGADAITEFKASQSFIDSYAEYYGIGFDDCLKQVALSFPDLDLSRIIMDELEPMTPVGDVIVDEGDKSPRSNLPPKDDGTIVLAQLGANPSHVFASNPLVMPVDVETLSIRKMTGTLLTLLLPNFALCVFHYFATNV